jgi:hypothetical protein
MTTPHEFKIEKGVPMPKRRGRLSLYPFGKMSVGDSIFLPKIRNASNLTQRFRKKGWKFSARTVNGGVRVWRIA